MFALAGEAAAWHLGYLDRSYDSPVRVWIPEGNRARFGVRSHIAVVRLGWRASTALLVGPDRKLLRRKRLDLTQWPTGIWAGGVARTSVDPTGIVRAVG